LELGCNRLGGCKGYFRQKTKISFASFQLIAS
jgi:hypothetical protein